MTWLEDMCERARNTDKWIDGAVHREAFDAMGNVGARDGPLKLIQMLIDRVNELEKESK